MKKLLFLLLLLASLCTQAQVLHTIEATKEPWASGACCSNGTYYHFTWRYYGPVSQIRLDSMYIEGIWYAAPTLANGSLRIDTLFTGGNFVGLVNGPSRSRPVYNQIPWEGEGAEVTPEKPVGSRKPPKAKGDAVLVYWRGTQRLELAIPKLKMIYAAARP